MFKRIEIPRQSFAKHFVRSFFTRGYSQANPKQAKSRKFIAILMLALIGGFYAAPLLQAASSDPEAGLPVCCRRHGRHHCAMMGQRMEAVSTSQPQIGQIPQQCPLYPHSATAPAVRSHAGLAPSAAFFAQVVSHPAVLAQTRAVYRLSLDRSRQKRGPPSASRLTTCSV